MELKNSKLSINVNALGAVESIAIIGDDSEMNWVITESYLKEVGFEGEEKLFGCFDFTVGGKTYTTQDGKLSVQESQREVALIYTFEEADIMVKIIYELAEDHLKWRIFFENTSDLSIKIEDFGVWASFTYVMFRDTDVTRNVMKSAAIFPSVSPDYTKLAIMRRSLKKSSLAVYQEKGQTLSVGTFCEYHNKFFEDVSPSLDGLLYHRLILSGGYLKGGGEEDWIYPKIQHEVQGNQALEWGYAIEVIKNQDDFYETGTKHGHPKIDYPIQVEVNQSCLVQVTTHKRLSHSFAKTASKTNIAGIISQGENQEQIVYQFSEPGEHAIYVEFTDGTSDLVVLNVIDSIKALIDKRVEYICEKSYQGEFKKPAHVFLPLSNQGESLGKLSLVIKKNLLSSVVDRQQIKKVEKSVSHYVLPKWFKEGKIDQPKNVYGNFYRVMDFEYLGHLLFLLSQVASTDLSLHSSVTYLKWAADVVELRINPERHQGEREQAEAKMLGVFFLYIDDLLQALKEADLVDRYHCLSKLWKQTIRTASQDSSTYRLAVTEHYYDNAGFGPAAAAFSNAGEGIGVNYYGDLLLANIGFSNDFRSQNPDRWWEALSYMIHSLWGGISAAAALDTFHYTKDPRFLEASYRATVGVLYCYDNDSTATTKLATGAAASTYAVAGPNLNRPDLSRNRFGQETFAQDGGIFAKLFADKSETSDWDMGEELVAYLDRFGQDGYCYIDETGALKGVNATVEAVGSHYRVTNMAPYPRHLYLLKDKNLCIINVNGDSEVII